MWNSYLTRPALQKPNWNALWLAMSQWKYSGHEHSTGQTVT